MAYCPNCGCEVGSEDAFCRDCGQSLNFDLDGTGSGDDPVETGGSKSKEPPEVPSTTNEETDSNLSPDEVKQASDDAPSQKTGTGIDAYLMPNETVKGTFSSRGWEWAATDRRLIKHRGRGSREKLFDISYDEIAGVSLEDSGKNNDIFVWSMVFLIGGFSGFILEVPTLGGLSLIISLLLFVVYSQSNTVYFEFRGGGLLSDEPERWRIERSSSSDWEDAKDFVTTVRRQIGSNRE